jgi:hypothetical protein
MKYSVNAFRSGNRRNPGRFADAGGESPPFQRSGVAPTVEFPACCLYSHAENGTPSHFLNDGLSLNCLNNSVVIGQQIDYDPL